MLQGKGAHFGEETMSKRLLVLTAIAAIVASPALAAQSTHRGHRADSGYAASNGYRPANSNVVIDGNRVVGQDPDANIRFQLRRDSAVSDY
jgi:hypothetical protein